MAKKIWTVSEVIEKIQDECDLQEETFIDQAEYIEYINEAIDEAEAEIHNVEVDYFHTTATINLEADKKNYPLPANLYANKLKHVLYKQNSTRFHKVKWIRPFETAMAEESTLDAPEYYHLQNDGTAVGVEIIFYPTPIRTETGTLRLWYVRNAERVSALTDKVDIPEFASFIFAYLKVKVGRKELSPLLDSYIEELESQRTLMKQTLADMIVDDQKELPMDLSFYYDFDSTHWEPGYF